MNMFVYVPPMRERVLTPRGLDVLNAVAALHINLGRATVMAVKARNRSSDKTTILHTMQELENARLITITNNGNQKIRAHMTDAGWAVTGNRPEWMAGE